MKTAPAGRPDPRRREPLWTRVERNRIRLAAYVALFVVSAVAAAESMFVLFGGCWLLYFGTRSSDPSGVESVLRAPVPIVIWSSAFFAAGALVWALYAINRSEHWLVRRLGATLVSKGELVPTKMALKDMSLAGGLPIAPALYLLPETSVNAFVFSARGRRPVVGVTAGLVSKFDLDEQRAIFANLIARIVSGDTIVDTGVAAMMLPLNTYRDRQQERDNHEIDREFVGRRSRYSTRQPYSDGIVTPQSGDAAFALTSFFLFGIAMAIVGSVFVLAQRRRQLRAAEKADAEGMLLLKDPRPMLSALEKCVVLNNSVPESGPSFSDLFYCWPGVSSNDEDDPEWERVARLREVLGVEGMVDVREPVVPEGLLAPQAPRIDRLSGHR